MQAMYKIDNVKFFNDNTTVIPFIKYQYFDALEKHPRCVMNYEKPRMDVSAKGVG